MMLYRYACGMKHFETLYWIRKRYAVCDGPYGQTDVQTKLEIEHASVGLAHARPISNSTFTPIGKV